MSRTKSSAKEQNPIRWLISATRPYHGMVLLISFLAVASAAVSLWSAVLLKSLIDAAVDGDKNLLIRSSVTLALVLLVSIATSLLSRYLKERTSYLAISSLQIRLFSVLLKKDYYHVTRFHSQEWLNRINEDSVTVANAISIMIPGMPDLS